MRRSWPAVLIAANLALVCLLTGCSTATDLAKTSAEGSKPAPAASTDHAADGDGSNNGADGDRSDKGADGDGSNDDSESSVRLRLPNVVGPRPVFLTPSRNIGCSISTDAVRCDIIEQSYQLPRKPADCSGDFGHSISVGRHGIASFICVTDTVVDRGAPVLDYGTSTEVGDFGCTSSEEHIACYYLKSRHGFELSRESPALF